MQNIPKIPFKEIVKNPQVYLLVVAVSIAWFFVYKFTDSSKELIDSQNKTIEIYKEREKQHTIIEYRKDRVIDSLQGLILQRTDNSYEELKKMLNIDNSKKSTIIIKPKRK